MSGYAMPDVIVSTKWVEERLDDAKVVTVEVDVDTALYDEGHIPGAIGWSWTTQLCDTVRRDVLSREAMEDLLSLSGISRDSTIVLYGDNNNWFAAWAVWQLALYGHENVRLMDGGRKKWMLEKRPVTRERPVRAATTYRISAVDPTVRALLPEVRAHMENGVDMVDVRSPQEFTGEILAPPGLPETCQRGGHIPGARNVPWSEVVNDEDGTFKPAGQLREIYRTRGIDGKRPVITYCRIGERSSHTWFVLRYLLGFEDVRNYDGSWTEWGNLVGAPVARGA